MPKFPHMPPQSASRLQQEQATARARQRAINDVSALLLAVPYPAAARAAAVAERQAHLPTPVLRHAAALADWIYANYFVPQTVAQLGDQKNAADKGIVAVSEDMLKPVKATADSVLDIEARRHVVDAFLLGLDARLRENVQNMYDDLRTCVGDLSRRDGACVYLPAANPFAWAVVADIFADANSLLQKFVRTGQRDKCLQTRRQKTERLKAEPTLPRAAAQNDNRAKITLG